MSLFYMPKRKVTTVITTQFNCIEPQEGLKEGTHVVNPPTLLISYRYHTQLYNRFVILFIFSLIFSHTSVHRDTFTSPG